MDSELEQKIELFAAELWQQGYNLQRLDNEIAHFLATEPTHGPVLNLLRATFAQRVGESLAKEQEEYELFGAAYKALYPSKEPFS